MSKNKSQSSMLQPTMAFKVNFVIPSVINLKLIDIWFKDVLKIENEALDMSTEIFVLTGRALLLIKTLLQASKIPAFYTGTIIDITSDQQNKSKYLINISVAYIDMIPQRGYINTINAAFNAIIWMMQNQPTSKNIKILYESMLDKTIQQTSKMIHAGKSTVPVLRVAYEKNIPFTHLGAGVYQLGWGSQSRKMDRSTTDRDSALGSRLSQNKVNSANLIRMAGLPAPQHGVASKKEDAINLAYQLHYPIVIKPSDLDRGEGVSVNINNDTQLASAFEQAYNLSRTKKIIVEKQVEGVCYRLFIAEGRLLYCVKRNPKSIKGDGLKTIFELINEANLVEHKMPPWLKTTLFPDDDLALESIQSLGYTFNSIPKAEELVPLRPIESTAWGIHSEDFTKAVHPDNLDIAIRTAALFELDVAGIDIISADISVPWFENGAIINEVNFSPLLGGGEISRSYIPDFLNSFINENGRIPIEIFVCDETSIDAAYQRQEELIKNGVKCFLTTHIKTITHEKIIIPFTYQRLYQRCKALMLNKQVDALIVVVQTDEVLHMGLAFDLIDNVTILSKQVLLSQDTETYANEESFNNLSSYLDSLKSRE